MSRNSITVSASPEAVFAVLDDAHAYPRWVVGARRVRRVDPNWPAVGSRFHHAIGTAAGELHDSSKVLERQPPDRIVLEVRFRPTGVANVEIDVERDGENSIVTIAESPTSGPVSHLPGFITDPLLFARNALALQRLRHEIERREGRSMTIEAESTRGSVMDDRKNDAGPNDPSAGGRDTATGTDPDAKYAQPGFEDKSLGQAVNQDMELVDELVEEEDGDLDRAEERFEDESAGSPVLERQERTGSD